MWNFNICTACKGDIRADSRISSRFHAFKNAGSSQNLRAVANGSNRFLSCEKFLNNFNDSWIQTNILRSTAACNKETNIISSIYCIKISS